MKSLTNLIRDFHNSRIAFEKLHADTPRIYGVIGVKVIRENFDLQGFAESNGAVQKWKPRSETTNKMYDSSKRYKGSVYSSKNPILKQTGNYYDAVNYRATQKQVRIGVNENQVPYARLNNEGGMTTLNGKRVYVPQRKAIGMSQKLKDRAAAELKKKRQQAFSKFRMI